MTCGDTLLAEGVNIIVLTGIDPSSIASVVSAAKAKGVPVVDMGGQVAAGFATAIYPNEAYSGHVLALYLKASWRRSRASRTSWRPSTRRRGRRRARSSRCRSSGTTHRS